MEPHWYIIGWWSGWTAREGGISLPSMIIGGVIGLGLLWLILELDDRYDIFWRLFRL